MENKSLGRTIAILRKKKGLTQKELGNILGVSDKTISHWEREETSPDLTLIPLIAETFGITANELMTGEKEEPEKEAPAAFDTPAPATKITEDIPQKRSKNSSLEIRTLVISLILLILCGLNSYSIHTNPPQPYFESFTLMAETPDQLRKILEEPEQLNKYDTSDPASYPADGKAYEIFDAITCQSWGTFTWNNKRVVSFESTVNEKGASVVYIGYLMNNFPQINSYERRKERSVYHYGFSVIIPTAVYIVISCKRKIKEKAQ